MSAEDSRRVHGPDTEQPADPGDLSLHPDAPTSSSIAQGRAPMGVKKGRYPNGVILIRSGWSSGRGGDCDVVWAALRNNRIVGAWHGTTVGSRESWALGSTSRRDPNLLRFAAWRMTIRRLEFPT